MEFHRIQTRPVSLITNNLIKKSVKHLNDSNAKEQNCASGMFDVYWIKNFPIPFISEMNAKRARMENVYESSNVFRSQCRMMIIIDMLLLKHFPSKKQSRFKHLQDILFAFNKEWERASEDHGVHGEGDECISDSLSIWLHRDRERDREWKRTKTKSEMKRKVAYVRKCLNVYRYMSHWLMYVCALQLRVRLYARYLNVIEVKWTNKEISYVHMRNCSTIPHFLSARVCVCVCMSFEKEN